MPCARRGRLVEWLMAGREVEGNGTVNRLVGHGVCPDSIGAGSLRVSLRYDFFRFLDRKRVRGGSKGIFQHS